MIEGLKAHEEPKHSKLLQKQCPYCGTWFDTYNPHQIYCCENHTKYASKEKRRLLKQQDTKGR